MNTLLLLLPDLALIATGAVLARTVAWADGFWSSLEKLVYFVLFPALLFTSIVRNRIDLAEVASFAFTVFLVLAGGIVLGALGRRLFGVPHRRFSSAVQCAFRFNSYLALALSQRLGGEAGLALCAVVAAVVVPTGNIASVWFLARAGGGGMWRAVIRNPLVLSTLGGLLFNLLGLSLPDPVSSWLTRMGAAAIALGLITVGAGLQPASARGDDGFAGWTIAVKLIGMPLLALGLIRFSGLAMLPAQVLMLYAAVPASSSAYVLATRMGGDGPYVARLITLSTLGSIVTMPLWLALIAP